MMGSYGELRKEFEGKVKKLREGCTHQELTDWIEAWSGESVKLCEKCGKIIEIKEMLRK